jgi:hypothetical protein
LIVILRETIFAGRPQSRYHIPRGKSRTSLRVHPQRAVAAPLVEGPHVELDVDLTIAVLRRRDRAGGAKCKHNRQESRALHAR